MSFCIFPTKNASDTTAAITVLSPQQRQSIRKALDHINTSISTSQDRSPYSSNESMVLFANLRHFFAFSLLKESFVQRRRTHESELLTQLLKEGF